MAKLSTKSAEWGTTKGPVDGVSRLLVSSPWAALLLICVLTTNCVLLLHILTDWLPTLCTSSLSGSWLCTAKALETQQQMQVLQQDQTQQGIGRGAAGLGISDSGSGGDPNTVGTSAVAAAPGYVPPTFMNCELTIIGGRDWPPPKGYGAWPICINHVPPSAIIYSFGIGGDISFDMEMIRRGGTVFGFDPTLPPDNPLRFFIGEDAHLRKNFTFMQAGLGATNAVVEFSKGGKGVGSMTALQGDAMRTNYERSGLSAPVMTLPTFMAIYKHDHVDVLKIDVEGVEFQVCETPEFLDTLPKVGQLLFEFHDRMMKDADEQKARCGKLLFERGFTLVNDTIAGEHVFARMAEGATLPNQQLVQQQLTQG